MSSEKLEIAIKNIEAGDKNTARGILSEILTLEPKNELAWFWLSKCVEDYDRQHSCLMRVLTINPNNSSAREALAKLEQSSQLPNEKTLATSSKVAQQSQLQDTKTQNQSTDTEQLIERAILGYADKGWRLVYRDKSFAQLIQPKHTDAPLYFMLTPLIAFGFAIFISITTFDFNNATGILYIGSSIGFWLTGLAVARWFGMKDQSLFLYVEKGIVQAIRS